jgi:hypothetical protein
VNWRKLLWFVGAFFALLGLAVVVINIIYLAHHGGFYP